MKSEISHRKRERERELPLGGDSVRLRKTYLLLLKMEAVGESERLPEVAGRQREKKRVGERDR